MAERMESYVMWAFRIDNHSHLYMDELERRTALEVVRDLRAKQLHVSRDYWESYDREQYYAHVKAREAISRMLKKGQLRMDGSSLVSRPNPGPSRECCYQIFSEIHSMEGPKYTELGRPSWGTQYLTE